MEPSKQANLIRIELDRILPEISYKESDYLSRVLLAIERRWNEYGEDDEIRATVRFNAFEEELIKRGHYDTHPD